MLAIALAIGMLTNSCPIMVGVARDEAVFSSRMQGWYKTSDKTLANVFAVGCYNDNNPSKFTSVDLNIAPSAPKERVNKSSRY